MELIFLLTLATLFTHELDAVRRKEWRFLPLIRNMPDSQAELVFILAHIPLFAGLIWFGWHQDAELREAGRIAICGFCVLHIGLHWLFRAHPSYAFAGWVSQGLIWAAGLGGAIYLLAIISL